MTPLNENQIRHELEKLSGWYKDGDSIRKDWVYTDFKEALHFINLVGEIAEKNNHHPEIVNIYNRVSLRFNTHDVGGITETDFSLASEVDKL